MMKLFHEIETEQVILRSKGTFSQVPLFQRDEILFAKKGSGFIRLMENGKTSSPSVFWDDMDVKYTVVTHGHLRKK